MKNLLIIFLLSFSSLSWGCILMEGEVKINNDSLKISQKFNLDESYPYRTPHFIVHLKLLSAKKNSNQPAQIIVRHPKTFKILLDKRFELPYNKEVQSGLSNEEIKLTASLKLKNI